jgi:hypothetical protein
MRLGGRGLRSFGLGGRLRLLEVDLAAYRVGRPVLEQGVLERMVLFRGMPGLPCFGQAGTESRWSSTLLLDR